MASTILIDTLIKTMKRIGKFHSISGKQKKKLVIEILALNIELNEDLKKLVVGLIDVIISLDQGELRINSPPKSSTRLLLPSLRSLRNRDRKAYFFSGPATNGHGL